MNTDGNLAITASSGNTSDAAIQSVKNYYEETLPDYINYLSLESHLCMHFGFFDELTENCEQAVVRMNEVLADHAKIAKGDRVFDAGCGLGGTSIWLAKEREAEVTGITVFHPQCEHAKMAAEKEGVANRTEFIEGDFCNTGLPDESFDVIWSNEALCHSDNKEGFLTESLRLLKPGGRLIVGDAFIHRPTRNFIDRQLLNWWQNGWVIDLQTIETFSNSAEKAGFKDVEGKDITRHVEPYANFLSRIALGGLPLAIVRSLFGAYTKTRFKNGWGALVLRPSLKRKLWHYVIFTARKPKHK